MKRVLLVSLGLIAMASYAGCLPEEGTTTGTGGCGGAALKAGGNPRARPATPGAGGTTGDGRHRRWRATAPVARRARQRRRGTGGRARPAAARAAAGRGRHGRRGRGRHGGTAGRGGTGGGDGGRGGAGGTARGGAGGSGAAAPAARPTRWNGRHGRRRTAGTGGSAPRFRRSPSCSRPPAPIGSLDGRLLTMPCDENTHRHRLRERRGGLSAARTSHCCRRRAQRHAHLSRRGRDGTAVQGHHPLLRDRGAQELRQASRARRRARPGRTTPRPTAERAPPRRLGPGHRRPPHVQRVGLQHQRDPRLPKEPPSEPRYYLNADTQEGHWTYVINYAKQITVYGGGTVRVRNYDRNCRQIKNCGSVDSYPCAAKANARIITIPATVMPAVPAGALTQPNLVVEPQCGQRRPVAVD